MPLCDTPGIHPSPPKYTPLLNTVKHLAYTRASQNLLLPPEGSQSMFRKFYVPKVLCSEGFIFRRFSRTVEGIHIYIGLYIIPGDVQCIRTVILLPTRGCGIFDFTKLWADLGLEVGQVDLLCPSGWGGGGGANALNAPPPPSLRPCNQAILRKKMKLDENIADFKLWRPLWSSH